MINEHPNWELAGIYADEESGTGVYKREQFLQLIADCEAGQIDLVLTKSISRWARNTLDSLNYIRKLKTLGIPIIFTKEGINTMDVGGEVLVTILSSLAQQESASISQNTQIGLRYHFQEGKICGGVQRLLGFNRTEDGTLEIVPHEADIIRRIYRDFLDGYSPKAIAKRLAADGVDGSKVTITGKKIDRNWNYQNIEYILKNEKYSGDLLLQKYYTIDYLTKKVAPNNGQMPQYYVESAHDPVVPKEIFIQTGLERERRREQWKNARCYENPLSGKVICAECGAAFRHINPAKGALECWRCGKKGTICQNGGVRDEVIRNAVITAMNTLPDRAEELVRLDERLSRAGIERANELLSQIEESDPQHLEILKKRGEYIQRSLHIRSLLERIDAISGREVEPATGAECRTIDDFFAMTRPPMPIGPVTEVLDEDVERLIEWIVVGEKITIEFKAGISVEVNR